MATLGGRCLRAFECRGNPTLPSTLPLSSPTMALWSRRHILYRLKPQCKAIDTPSAVLAAIKLEPIEQYSTIRGDLK